MKKEIHVVGAIIVKNGKILCCQRGADKSLANLWEFPGGKIEQAETKVQALRRELIEELRIQVNIQEEAFEFCRYDYDFGFVNLTTFICQLNEGEPQLTEHIQVKWLLPSELETVEWAPADVPTVEKLMKYSLGSI